jgi:hypothetical protein
MEGAAYNTLEDYGFGDISIQQGKVTLPQDLISQVDYWEIDPDWNADIFQSRFQAARPWRKGEIHQSIQLPQDHRNICLRIVLINGDLIQEVL